MCQSFGWEPRILGHRCNPSSGVRLGACCSEEFAVEESAFLTCHAEIPSAAARTERQVLAGPVESPPLCEESVFATQMYDDGDLSLTSISLVDKPVPSAQVFVAVHVRAVKFRFRA